MAHVEYELRSEQIGLITLNDPENLNAMGEEMAKAFAALVAKLESDAQRPRVLVLTGAGRAFSAGGNLAMLEKKTTFSGEVNRQLMLDFYHSFLGILDLKIPLIAAINGHAIGAGLCVACACDVRVAQTGAKLGFTFTKLGLHPGMGGTFFLPKVVGTSMAAELMLTGRVIDADEGFRIGLVSKVAPEQVLETALGIAKEILACGPEATRHLLETLRGYPRPLADSLEREALCQSINYASAEFKEGVRATIEKRAPNFGK